MKKNLILIVAIVFSINYLFAQHLFSVSYNELSKESVTHLKLDIGNRTSEIVALSLSKNIEDKDLFSVPISSEIHSQIILLNEQTGNHVVITPAEESITELQLTPFFIEELRQGALGEAERYLIIETLHATSPLSIASVAVNNGKVAVPQYFYGKKENVKEALPHDRQIVHIFKEKPSLILTDPDDPELQRYAAQWEEERSYYVYMYQLPDGMLCTFAEEFMCDYDNSYSYEGSNVVFNLSGTGTMTEEQIEATEFALELWSERLAGCVPVKIDVTLVSLATGILGSSARMPQYELNSTWYCSAVGNQLAGYNVSSSYNIKISMNKNINFYYGLDAQTPKSSYDYLTIMLHEITHGLGFFPICGKNGTYTYTNSGGSQQNTQNPGAFDRLLCEGLDGPPITELTASERAALMVSDNLYAGIPGSHLLAANEGVRVKIYAPTTYNPGSSNSHWDNSVSFPTFMKYSIGTGPANALHHFNNRKSEIMFDLGWELPTPEPNAQWVNYKANGGVEGAIFHQKFLPGESKKLKPNTFQRDGYTALQWNTSADGTGTPYNGRDLISISNDLDLYAQWEPNKYTLNLNPNGGKVTPSSIPVVFDTPIGELPIPEREGYTFHGWTIDGNIINKETTWTYPFNNTAKANWWKIGIEEIPNTPLLQIIPNPASHTIELQVTSYELRVDNVEFYNNSGQLVKIVTFEKNNIRDGMRVLNINIADLSTGVYFVKAGESTVKLIVQ
jgi:hypothetical protein